MDKPCYRGTNETVRSGDVVRWHNDAELSVVMFVVSTGDFLDGDAASNA